VNAAIPINYLKNINKNRREGTYDNGKKRSVTEIFEKYV